MVVQKKGGGERLMPRGHSGAVSEILFSPSNGCSKAVIHVTTLEQGGGLNAEEIHQASDQIFHVFSGEVEVYSGGTLFGTMKQGDALLVNAGDSHGLCNSGTEECVLYVITAPPLDS